MRYVENLIVGALVLFVFYTIFMFGLSVYRGSMCVENGYPRYYMSFNLDTYCIRIVEQTEYVVPLEEVLRESK